METAFQQDAFQIDALAFQILVAASIATGGGTSKRDKRKRKKPRYYSDDQPLIPVKPDVLIEIEAKAAEATRAEMARRITEQTDDDALAISLIMAALK